MITEESYIKNDTLNMLPIPWQFYQSPKHERRWLSFKPGTILSLSQHFLHYFAAICNAISAGFHSTKQARNPLKMNHFVQIKLAWDTQ
jgi:hypothetical protein